MDTATADTSLVDNYFSLLKDSSPDNKLELIAQLSKSMKTKEANTDSSLQSLFGAWKSDETADELATELKNSRVFKRNIEPL